MAGINQGRPENAVGEPIRLGSNDEFEIEHHPISDRLIIRDTVNGKVAYVRKERGGSIGGDGVLVKALKEGKPMNDKGRTYDTIQEAERQASSWVFVPPGTFNESVTVTTQNLTIRGSGYNTHVQAPTDTKAFVSAGNTVKIQNLSLTADGSTNAVVAGANSLIQNITIRSATGSGVFGIKANNADVINCEINDAGDSTGGFGAAINARIVAGNILNSSNNVALYNTQLTANNVVNNPASDGIRMNSDDAICIGNRFISAGQYGVRVNKGSNCIVANNRISDSATSDISDAGTGTLLDSNLTGASN